MSVREKGLRLRFKTVSSAGSERQAATLLDDLVPATFGRRHSVILNTWWLAETTDKHETAVVRYRFARIFAERKGY